MLHLLAAVVATPVPSPTIIKETLQPIIQQAAPVVQTPEVVIQLAQLIGLGVSVALVSIVHQLIERGKWSGNMNRILVALYTTGGAAYTAYSQGQLQLNAQGALTLLTALGVALGVALGRFELFNFIANVYQGAVKLVKPAPALAVDATEAAAEPVAPEFQG